MGSHFYNPENGEITVRIPPHLVHGKVVLYQTETLQRNLRDYRWFRLHEGEDHAPCTFPHIPLPIDIMGASCFAPMIWIGTNLEESEPNTFVGRPRNPLLGGWTGYYVAVFFPSDTGLNVGYQLTTPGWTWPNEFPFDDCTLE